MIFAIYWRTCWIILSFSHFTWGSLLYLKFCLPFIVSWIFKIAFFCLINKTHILQKNWLLVHSTTMWASFSHLRVSMVLSFSTSARPLSSVIRDSFEVMKILSFSSTNMVLKYDFFFFVCSGGNWFLFHYFVSVQIFLPLLGTDTHPFLWRNKSKNVFFW